MPATYEPIASTTLGADATVTFSNIGATWTDLLLVGYLRSSSASANRYVGMRFNGDTGTNYSGTELRGSGSSASSGRFTNLARLPLGGVPGNGATSNVFSVTIAHIMSYANTNVFKTVLFSSDAQTNTDQAVTRGVGLWRSTNAITSISVSDYGDGVDLETGCVLALYGIKAA